MANLDIRTKLFILTAGLFLTLWLNRWLVIFSLMMGFLLLAILAKINWLTLGKIVLSLLPILFIIVSFGYWFPPKRVDAKDAMNYALVLGIRLLATVILSSIAMKILSITEIITLAQHWRVPNALVLMLTIGLRFVPTLMERYQQIKDAQWVRGARFNIGGPIKRTKAHLTIMIPLFVSSLKTSDDLAAAMLTRGYGAEKRPTQMYKLTWKTVDTLLMILVSGITISVMVLGK